VIEFHKVRKEFEGGVVAVDDASFEVPQGHITCIIGSSGCGKTTTLRMINRLIEPSSGEIRIGGKPIQETDVISLRRSIGYVIQGAALMPHMSVQRNISLLEESRGRSLAGCRERIEELMELVGMPHQEYARRYPSELSGGQQQRVGIARSLMADPPVLLMDEPFGALDPITRHRMQAEFLEINRKLHKTIVLVTHDLSEAFKLGDEIILMSEGAIVQKGSAKDFLQSPQNEFVEEFIRSQIPPGLNQEVKK